MWEIFLKGGPMMWPLLALSLVTVSVLLERIWFFACERRQRGDSVWSEMYQLIEGGELQKALGLGHKHGNPVTRALVEGLSNHESCFEEAVSCQAEVELERYNRGLNILDAAVTVAPLLGLLGTVTGMIQSFGLLGASELDAPVAITGGIAEALIATAFGLGIAIVAVLVSTFVRAASDRLTREIEDRATRTGMLLKRRVKNDTRHLARAA